MIGVIMLAWVGARAAFWENPFAGITERLPRLLVEAPPEAAPPEPQAPRIEKRVASITYPAAQRGFFGFDATKATRSVSFAKLPARSSFMAPGIANSHSMLLSKALSFTPKGLLSERAMFQPGLLQPPFAPPLSRSNPDPASPDRWSLDSWAFWRQGSNSSLISQGRVPIYGASQLGASLQYRLAPSSRRDPRLYARAYRALVRNGENEVSVGVSVRPLSGLPLRAQAEGRLTNTPFGTEVRPAAFVVTEIAPQRLPLGLTAEMYGQAGYVGGDTATGFADGQVAVTREVKQFDLTDTRNARLSVGAGAWGGVQKDATRVDLGPTLRLDLTIGKVPARLSVDWREQVVGDAAPESGVAATLSTRF